MSNNEAQDIDGDQPDLLDYDEDADAGQEAPAPAEPKKDVKGTYVSIHSSGFRDFLLKPELLRSIVDCGFEHPSEGRSACGPLPGFARLVPTGVPLGFSICSASGMHPSSYPRNGCSLPGQVWYGKNSSIRTGNVAAAGTC